MSERHVWRFAEAGRCLAAAATLMELDVPAFRTPPRVAGLDRTIRRGPDGSALVSVRSRGRRWPAVLADMIEGVVAANGLDPPEAARVRDELWQATEDIDAPATALAESLELPLSGNTEVRQAA
ncbi:MAG: hypothetical protein OXG55_07110 [bacterium]|nr:hypothetical protein [bacterium]MCY4103011.1 hypothetical protein [bacterium]